MTDEIRKALDQLCAEFRDDRWCGVDPPARAALERAIEAEVARERERRLLLAASFGVADGGQYRADIEERATRVRAALASESRVKALEGALHDLLESVNLIRDWFGRYGRSIEVIDGFLLGSHERARAALAAGKDVDHE